MPKLLSRTKWVPHGFQVLHPEAGMKKPFVGGFNECVAWEFNFRKKNPVLAQRLSLPIDRKACEDYVDDYNARRCLAAGFTAWVDMGVAAPAEKKTRHGLDTVVGGVVSKARAAVSAYAAMFGALGPVDKAQATARATVCVACPHNSTDGGLVRFFTQGAAEEIMGVLGALKDLDLTTPQHDRLGVCNACSCPLKAKVFAPLKGIVDKMPASVWRDLPQTCWLRTESGRYA